MLQPHPGILQLQPQLRQLDLHLLRRPPPQLRHRAHRNRLQTLQELHKIKSANLLQPLILRPRAGRDGQ